LSSIVILSSSSIVANATQRDLMAGVAQRPLLSRRLEIVIDHLLHELREAALRAPIELGKRVGRIALQVFDLRGAEVTRVDVDEVLVVEAS